MDKIKKLIEIFRQLYSHSKDPFEIWERLLYKGENFTGLPDLLYNLIELAEEFNISDSLGVEINDDLVDKKILREDYIEDDNSIDSWKITFYKEPLTKLIDEESNVITFYTEESFQEWVAKLEPFSINNPIRKKSPVKILVYGLQESFGGPRIAVSNLEEANIPPSWPYTTKLPDEMSIKTQVHVATSETLVFAPEPFYLEWGNLFNQYSAHFLRFSIQTLAVCLVQDYFLKEKVILHGARRLEIPFTTGNESLPEEKCLKKMREAVEWVYEERTETRAKLLSERLSLDLPRDRSLVSSICEHIDDALKQSKEQYGFVILDRKDQYIKEMSELLKDVRTHSELYATKTRSVLNNLLRDVLAALFLIGFSVFGKFISQNVNILNSSLVNLLFKSLSIYFLASLLLQSIVHIPDLIISRKEISCWKNITRAYMSKEEIEEHINKPLKNRKVSLISISIILAITYLLLAYASWNFQKILSFF